MPQPPSLAPPRAGAPAPGRARRGGFTLIELLVVVVIIGVITTLVSLSVRGSAEDELEREARRLARVMEIASDFAVMRGEEYGLLVEEGAYRVLRLGESGWESPPASVLRAHELPADMELRLFTEGEALELAGSDDGLGAAADAPAPQVLLLSSADITPFEVELSAWGIDERWRLGLDLQGRLELSRDAL